MGDSNDKWTTGLVILRYNPVEQADNMPDVTKVPVSANHHYTCNYPDSKVYGANMGSTSGRQDPGGPHVGPINLDISIAL